MLDFYDNHIQALPIIILILLIYSITRRKKLKAEYCNNFNQIKKKILLNEAARLIFLAWCMEIICCTLFPTRFFDCLWSFQLEYIRFFDNTPSWQFVPTVIANKEILKSEKMLYMLICDAIVNILMFIPLGVLLPILWRKVTLLKTTFIGFACTVFIEIIQGFLNRNSNIDDVITNTVGAVLGYVLYLVIRKIFPKFIERISYPKTNETT